MTQTGIDQVKTLGQRVVVGFRHPSDEGGKDGNPTALWEEATRSASLGRYGTASTFLGAVPDSFSVCLRYQGAICRLSVKTSNHNLSSGDDG